MKHMKNLKSAVHAMIISIAYMFRVDHWPLLARSRKYGSAALFKAYAALENLGDSNPETNGEYAFLQRNIVPPTSKSDALVVFDVGANRGSYSRTVLAFADRNHVHIELHAFEPMQESFRALSDDPLLHRPNVHLNQCAVSSSEKEVIMYADEPDSEIASITPRDLRYRGVKFDYTEKIHTLRLDAYISLKKIARIDLMKIDVEDHELEVLHGLGDLLRPDIVRCIQFEYGGTSGTLFDLYSILEGAGYRIYRTTRSGRPVEKQYNPMMERFFSNYIAQDNPIHYLNA